MNTDSATCFSEVLQLWRLIVMKSLPLPLTDFGCFKRRYACYLAVLKNSLLYSTSDMICPVVSNNWRTLEWRTTQQPITQFVDLAAKQSASKTKILHFTHEGTVSRTRNIWNLRCRICCLFPVVLFPSECGVVWSTNKTQPQKS